MNPQQVIVPDSTTASTWMPGLRLTRRRVARAALSSMALLAALALGTSAYLMGWIGLGMVTLLPVAAVLATGAVLVGTVRGRIAWRSWREWNPAARRHMLVRASVRSAGWLTIGSAAGLSLPRSMMSRADAVVGTSVIAGSVIVLVLLSMAPHTRACGAVTVAIIALAAFSGWQLIELASPPAVAATIAAPVTGEWVVQTGGNSVLVNHHYPLRQQRYALDLAMPYPHDGSTERIRPEDFPSFGEPVTSPGSGEVARAEDTQQDQPIGTMAPEHPLGNFVVIRLAAERYVVVAHLQAGSLRVQPGDQVTTGEVIGRVGNSGNSSEPHLHIQVQTGPDLMNPSGTGWEDIDTIPFAFEGASGDGSETDLPRMDDRIVLGGATR